MTTTWVYCIGQIWDVTPADARTESGNKGSILPYFAWKQNPQFLRFLDSIRKWTHIWWRHTLLVTWIVCISLKSPHEDFSELKCSKSILFIVVLNMKNLPPPASVLMMLFLGVKRMLVMFNLCSNAEADI